MWVIPTSELIALFGKPRIPVSPVFLPGGKYPNELHVGSRVDATGTGRRHGGGQEPTVVRRVCGQVTFGSPTLLETKRLNWEITGHLPCMCWLTFVPRGSAIRI